MARKLPVVLSDAEVAELRKMPNVNAPTGLRNRAAMECLLGTGLRVSELCNLRPCQIFWAEKYVEVREGKGQKDRHAPATAEALGWMQAWRQSRPGGDWFFCTLNGRRMGTRYVQKFVKRYARRAGLERAERISPHTFRHTFATRMLEQGMSLAGVQDALGHSSARTTETYLHLRGGVARREMDRIEQGEAVGQIAKALGKLTKKQKQVLIETLRP